MEQSSRRACVLDDSIRAACTYMYMYVRNVTYYRAARAGNSHLGVFRGFNCAGYAPRPHETATLLRELISRIGSDDNARPSRAQKLVRKARP